METRPPPPMSYVCTYVGAADMVPYRHGVLIGPVFVVCVVAAFGCLILASLVLEWSSRLLNWHLLVSLEEGKGDMERGRD